MTDLTDEAVKVLLDGATPGPWRADGEPWNRIVWSSADNRICFMSHSNGLNDERDVATSNLAAAAPDIARALLAARADTEAAVALALEEAEQTVLTCASSADDDLRSVLAAAIRRLSPASGVAKLAKLRAEIDRLTRFQKATAADWDAVCQQKKALAAEVDRLRDRERRRLFPILKGEGAQIDYQLVADHAEQARSNHYQSVDRLAERGGLSWCELYAVLHNRKWEKIDTNEAMIACRALEARYLATLATDSDAALSAAQPAGMAGKGGEA